MLLFYVWLWWFGQKSLPKVPQIFLDDARYEPIFNAVFAPLLSE